ncbi:MAG: hypothetical protein ACR2QF_09800, partial [Geminicoccaceae bacterium]
MRLRRREIQIFTLSALDILATATGVFVLLLVLLMPYYKKTFDAGATIQAVRVQTQELTSEVEDLATKSSLAQQTVQATLAEATRINAEAETLEQLVAARVQPRPSAFGGAEEERVISELDLVFVIDTTASMRSIIRDLAGSLSGIVRILERLVPSVRVGVVA